MIVVDYNALQDAGKRFLTITEICALCDFDENEFRVAMASDPKIDRAIRKGNVSAIETAAKFVEDAYSGNRSGSDKDEFTLKAALALLDRHARGWRKAK